jgi:hypothetical protein
MAIWGIIDPKELLCARSEDMNHMYEEVKASAAGEFAPSTGVRIDATRRRIYVVKNSQIPRA